jgi:hypothetical protein
MSIEFTQPAEAYAAVAAVAVGTDGVGSLQERDALFGPIQALEVFAGTDFMALLGEVTDRVYSQLPMEGATFSAGAVDEVVAASKAVLSVEQQEDVCKMAAKLCVSDGQGVGEIALISQLRQGFGLS